MYADDLTLLADSPAVLQSMLDITHSTLTNGGQVGGYGSWGNFQVKGCFKDGM